MKALYQDSGTADFESRKSQQPHATPISGTAVYLTQVLKALLRHGTFDRLLLPGAYLPTAANPSDYYTFDPATGTIRNQFRDYTLAQCQALGGDRLGNLNN